MAATVFNQAQLELLEMMHWVKSPEALADLKQSQTSLQRKVKKSWMVCGKEER